MKSPTDLQIIEAILDNDLECECCKCRCDCCQGVQGGPNGPVYPRCIDHGYDKVLDMEKAREIYNDIQRA